MQLSVQARFYKILAAVWRHRYLLIIPPLLMPFIGLGMSKLSPRVYDSHTSFLIQESAKLNPFLKDLSVDTHIQQRIKALDTLLHSRHILNQVAEQQALFPENANSFERDRIIRRLSSQLTVALYGSDLISIKFRSPQKENMARILTSVRDVFINQLLAPERSSVSNSEQFLLNQLNRQRALLDQSEQALSEFKSQNLLQLPGLLNTSVNEISALKRQIADKETELAGQQAVLDSLHTQLIHSNPILGSLEKQIIRIKSDLVNLKARYTDKHSKVVAANNRLIRLKNERQALMQLTDQISDIDQLERLWRATGTPLPSSSAPNAASVTSQQGLLIQTQMQEVESSRARFFRIQQELAQLKRQQQELLQLVNSSGDTEQTLLRLNRDLEVQRKVYSELLDRYERAKITGALGAYEQRDRIKIIDEAFEPSAPSNLPAVIYIAAGLVAGIAMGCGTALVLEVSDCRLRYISEVQEIAQVPVLSRIPRIQEENYILDLEAIEKTITQEMS